MKPDVTVNVSVSGVAEAQDAAEKLLKLIPPEVVEQIETNANQQER